MIEKLLPTEVWLPLELWLRGLTFWELLIVATVFNAVVVYCGFVLTDLIDKYRNDNP